MRTNGEDSVTLVSGGGASRSQVPVQNTNIIQIINEHLPGEYSALLVAIDRQQEEVESKLRYKAQLEAIAADAGVTLVPPPKESEANA